MLNRIIMLGIIFLCCGNALCAPESDEDGYLRAKDDAIDWWREARFGMFIHWGPVSLKGTEISWSRIGDHRPVSFEVGGQIPAEEYDNLYKQFNPTKFDADQVAQLAKDAGMKYVVFTTKHHDGFCMFDTKTTDYNIMRSPFGRDITHELADACRARGLKFGVYYSPIDWYHPDFWKQNHSNYISYMKEQLRELLTNYGKVSLIWFDSAGSVEMYDSHNVFKMARRLQPDILLNNRIGLPGDFETPEQTVGGFKNDKAWESCITIGDQWSYRANENVKSLKECIDTLVYCSTGDGNLLLNIGPSPEGEIAADQSERLREMGQWLRKYGRSIYGTRGGPYLMSTWGGSTHKGNTIYLHILNWNSDVLILPIISANPVKYTALTGGEVCAKIVDNELRISVPNESRDFIDTIIAIEYDKPVSGINPVKIGREAITTGMPASASNVFGNCPDNQPGMAFDDNRGTRWATDAGVKSAWLQVDLLKPKCFDKVIVEEMYSRVEKFELQMRMNEGDDWQTFFNGNQIGNKLEIDVEPKTVRFVRLNITDAADGPSILEFQLHLKKP